MPLNAKLDNDPATPEMWTPIKLGYGKVEMERFAKYIAVRVENSNDSRRGSGFEDMVRSRRDEYEMQRRASQGPWPGSANLRLPSAYSIVSTMQAHLYKTLFGVQPFFMGIPSFDAVIPTEVVESPVPPPGVPPELVANLEEQKDQIMREFEDSLLASASRKEKALDYYLRYPLRFADTGSETLSTSLIDGGSVLEVGWRRKIEKKRRFDVVTPELRQEIWEKYAESAPQLAGQLDSYEDGQWVVIKDYTITEDNPFVERVDILDFNCYPADPKAGPPTDRMRHVISCWRRVWLSDGDLLAGVATGEFDKTAVETILEKPNNSPEIHSTDAGGDLPRHQAAGFSQDTEVDNEDKPYETFRGVIRYDCDGDGFVELVLFHIYLAGGTPVLLRAEEFPYFHDRFPFVVAPVIRRPNFLYPYSLVELLKPLSIERNAIRNQRVDNGTLRNMPTFLKSNTSKWNPEKTPFSPGLVISVNDVDRDIKLLEFPPADMSSFAEDRNTVGDMRELAGLNDTLFQGGGSKTATALDQEQQATNIKFDVSLDTCREWMDEVASQVTALLAQYSKPNSRIFSGFQKGRAVFSDISRGDMQTRMGFQARGTSALSNPVLKAQKAEKRYLWGERNEFVQYSPSHRYALAKDFLEGMADDYSGDPEKFIGSLEDFVKFAESQPPPGPEDKLSMTGRMDEVTTLSLALKKEWLSVEDLEIGANATKLVQTIILPPPVDVGVEDAPDNPPGYQAGGPA